MHSEYPSQYEKNVVLADGEQIFLRPIKPTDDDLMLEMFGAFSMETIHLRFFSYMKEMPKSMLEKFTHIDYDKQMAIVAIAKENDRDIIVGVGRYNVLPDHPDEAEFAIVVEDAYQKRGIGAEVLRYLLRIAKLEGVHVIVGYILYDNSHMRALLRKSGLEVSSKNWEDGIMRVEIPL